MRRTPRFSTRFLLIGIAIVAAVICLLPVEQWKEARAIKTLESMPFGISVESIPVEFPIGLEIPWRRTVAKASVTLYGSDETTTQVGPGSFAAFRHFSNLHTLHVTYIGGSSEAYLIPSAPANPAIRNLCLTATLIDKATMDSYATNLPSLVSIWIDPHADSEYSVGTYAKLFSLPKLEEVQVEFTTLDLSDVAALSQSNVRTLRINDCRVSDDSLALLLESKELRTLKIESREFTATSLECFEHAMKNGTLENVDITLRVSRRVVDKAEDLLKFFERMGGNLTIDYY